MTADGRESGYLQKSSTTSKPNLSKHMLCMLSVLLASGKTSGFVLRSHIMTVKSPPPSVWALQPSKSNRSEMDDLEDNSQRRATDGTAAPMNGTYAAPAPAVDPMAGHKAKTLRELAFDLRAREATGDHDVARAINNHVVDHDLALRIAALEAADKWVEDLKRANAGKAFQRSQSIQAMVNLSQWMGQHGYHSGNDTIYKADQERT